ncbi:hypothetical protein LWC35_14520 [Pseudonocardia kujensis]|uniref:class III lanthionine synthetase LanKC N-terminal domain-containing protein n=1 Tax=Pseudonocardia kujensis TaxID=1128675 RepID=UPI001E51EB49|nr:lanthionine synthetase LanC family protein [Pseudonocardia kujensis]MCE0764115.1 hypothetical protein [Pseudonocardia kujensis]
MTLPLAHSKYAEALDTLTASLGSEWAITRTPVGQWSWIGFQRSDVVLPAQGWKLHVSAPTHLAHLLLIDVAPELIRSAVAFKVPDRIGGVIELNSGKAGSSQVGKVITVYPVSGGELRAVVDQLQEIWRPATAPEVPSDLRAGEGLWIRYGPFDHAPIIVDALGRLSAGLLGPNGVVVPDSRVRAAAPAWAPEPPVPVSVPTPPPPGPIVVDGRRYLPLKALSTRVDSSVVAALAVHDVRLVVVRQAVAGMRVDTRGHDAVSRLDNEYRMLTELRDVDGCPPVLAYDAAAHILVTGDVGGQTVESLPASDGFRALPPLARLLSGIHEAGIVHRDVSPRNVLVDGTSVHLVDFELAAHVDEQTPIAGGTPGYLPSGAGDRTVELGDDVHALGSCLTYVALRCCPGRLPTGQGRRIGLLRRAGQDAAADLVTRLSDEPTRPSAGKAAMILDAMLPILSDQAAAAWAAPTTREVPGELRWSRRAAVAAGHAARSFATAGRRGRRWRTMHLYKGFEPQAINLGTAGIVLALTSIDEAMGRIDFSADVLDAAEWLAAEPPYERAHGLFTGNAGVAVALAVAGRRHDRPELIDAARVRLGMASMHAVADYDLFSGAAGIVRAGCLVAAVSGEAWPLDLVSGQVGRLHTACRAGAAPGWPASPDFDTSRAVYHGAAHGSAGIALALAEWGAMTGAAESMSLAVETFEGIHWHARTPEGDNIVPSSAGGRTFPALAWCHGLAGVVWCLEQAFGGSDTLAEVREQAVEAVLGPPPLLHDPTLCHGTAGALEVYRIARASPTHGDQAGKRVADAVAVLRVLQQRTPEGTVWGAEEPSLITPDLWVGFLGTAAALAMSAADVSHPLLSLAWLSRCAQQPVSREVRAGEPWHR